MVISCKITLFGCLIFLGHALAAQTTYESLRAGDAAYNRSNFSKAEPHYRRVTEKDPANWNATYNLGSTLYQQGKYEEAAPILEKAAQKAPNDRAKADALHNAGNAWLKQNKYGEAIKAYESSLRLHPGDPDTKMNLQMAKKKDKKEKEQQQQQQKQNQDQQKQSQQQQDQNKQQNQNQDQQQQQNQQQKDQQQPQQNQQNQPQQSPSQPNQEPKKDPQQLKQEEAKRMLETTIGPEDKKNARKYRSGQPNKAPRAGKKDW